MPHMLKTTALVGALALLAAPVSAQQNDWSEPQRDQDRRYQDDRSQTDRYQDRRSRDQRYQDQRYGDRERMRDPRFGPQQRQMGQGDWDRYSAQMDRRGGQQGLRLSGEIVKLKTVDRGDRSGANLVGQIETVAGDRVVVDLGDVKQWDKQRIRQRERVAVMGYPARVGNRLVLMADRVAMGEKRRSVERQGGTYTAERPMGYRQVRGTVQRTDTAPVRGGDRDNVIALITTEDGSSYIVDLGQARNYSTNRLEGQDVAVRGRDVRVKDKVVLLADQFRMGGETYTAMRPALVSYAQAPRGDMNGVDRRDQRSRRNERDRQGAGNR